MAHTAGHGSIGVVAKTTEASKITLPNICAVSIDFVQKPYTNISGEISGLTVDDNCRRSIKGCVLAASITSSRHPKIIFLRFYNAIGSRASATHFGLPCIGVHCRSPGYLRAGLQRKRVLHKRNSTWQLLQDLAISSGLLWLPRSSQRQLLLST